MKKNISKKIDLKKSINQKSKFMIASSSSRILARIIDLILLFLIFFFTGTAIFYNGVNKITNDEISYLSFIPILFGHNLYNLNIDQFEIIFNGWKYCLFSWEVFLVCFLWFIITPLFLKGRTIGKLVCKITTIDVSKRNNYFWWHLIKKELFLWEIMSIVLIIYGFVCLGLNNKAYAFNITYVQNADTNGFKSFSGTYIFVFLFSICGLIDALMVVWMFFSSHKMNLQDQFSLTTVIYIKSFEEKEKIELDIKPNLKKETKNVLPGEINIKELDKLLKKNKKSN